VKNGHVLNDLLFNVTGRHLLINQCSGCKL
jgi:hypothetical protein